MNGYHGDPETPDGFTRRHALLAGALYHRHIDHQQTVIPRCVGTVILSDDSVAPGQHMNAAQSYASPGDDTSTSTAPTLLDDGSYWSYSTDSCEAVPYQSSSYKAPTGYAYLQQQQAETQTSRDSEQTSWQAGAQSVVAATASTSASSNELTAQGIQHRQMPGSCRNQPHSPLLSTIDQLVSLQVRSDEVPSSFDDLSAGRADSSWPQNSQYVNPAQLQLPAGLQSQNEAGPWSTINPHNSISHREFEYQEQERTSVPLDGTGCLPTDLFSQNHGSLMPPEHTGMSNAAFNSDIEDIMGNSTTIRECEGYSQPLDLATHQIDQSQNNLPYEGVAFHCRLERAGTPQEVSTSGSYGQSDHRLVYLHPGDPSPRPQDRDPSSPSTGSSRWSVTSSSIPEILFCNILGCEARFRGNHRRGNLGRHMRRTHRGSPGDHLCAEPYCGKRFNRSDSRLKHYRSHHPWLTTGPPIRRGPQGTHLTDSSWELAGPRGG